MNIYRNIINAIRKKDYKHSLRLALHALNEDADNVHLIAWIAFSYWCLGKDEQAKEYINKGYSIDKNYPLLIWSHSEILFEAEQYEEAYQNYHTIVNTSIEGIIGKGFTINRAESFVNDARFRCAQCMYALYRTFEAKEMAEQHLQHRRSSIPSDFSKKEVLGFIKMLSFCSAKPSYADVEPCEPSNEQKERLWNHVETLGNNKAVIRYLSRKSKEFPQYYYLHTILAEYLLDNNEPAKALYHAEKAYEIEDEDMLVVYNYANALYHNHLFAQALEKANIIISKGLEYLAYSEHGEGMRWAKTMMRKTEQLINNIKNG